MKGFVIVILFMLSVSLSVARIEGDGFRLISGKVVDTDGTPLEAVAVIVAGSEAGTLTDQEGTFSIKMSADADTLVFSSLGYEQKYIKVTGNTARIKVVLKETEIVLDELVKVGYHSIRKRDLTTSVSSIGRDDIESSGATRLDEVLKGNVAGVTANTYSGAPGESLSIRIRGTSSILADSKPLFVIDGVMFDDLDNLNPEDVESIQILKDASSAAIYGARASNGVMLITTKKGTSGKPTINFSANVGIQAMKDRIEVLGSADYKELIDDAMKNAMMPSIDFSQYIDSSTGNFLHDTDWQDLIFGTGVKQNYNMSISGGSGGNTYYSSLNYVDHQGIISPSGFKRYGYKFNYDSRISDNIRIGANILLSLTETEKIKASKEKGNGVIALALLTPPFIPVIDADGMYGVNPFDSKANPVAQLDSENDHVSKFKCTLSPYAEINFWDNLKYNFRASVDYNRLDSKYFLDPYSTDWGKTNGGLASETGQMQYNIQMDNTLYFLKTTNRHQYSILAGNSVYYTKSHTLYAQVKGFGTSEIHDMSAGAIKSDASSGTYDASLLSWFASASYAYADKYYFTANFRADGSSKFASGNRWGFFPSCSFAWRISAEPFMDLDFLNDMKLRAGIGQTGNQNIPNNRDILLYDFGYNYVYGEQLIPGSAPSKMGNKNLKWETTTQYNIGIDIDLFRGSRLKLVLDMYYKKTDDLLYTSSLAPSTGFQNVVLNVGAIENKGLEIEANSINLNGIFKWQTDFNISFNRNKVLSIADDVPEIWGSSSNKIIAGEPLGVFWGYIAEGIDEYGDMIYKALPDENGENIKERKTVIGDPNPDFTAGMTNRFSYKGVSLLISLRGSYGNQILNKTKRELESMNTMGNQSTAVLDRWRKPGDELTCSLPRAIYGIGSEDQDLTGAATTAIRNNDMSTRFIEDGSFLKIQRIELSYTMNKKKLRRIKGISRLKLSLSVDNVYTLTRYGGLDPEINWGGDSNYDLGIDYFGYPSVAGVNAGIQVTF